MKLLVFSDIHGDEAALQRLMAIEADYYFAAGDLSSWGRGLDRLGPLLAARGERVWVLPGNHESAEAVASFARRWGLNDFHERSFRVAGYHIAGLGYSNPTPFDTPGEYSEEEIARRLEKFASLEPLVLICHCPPWNTPLDRVREGVHAGSRSLREFVERVQPAYLFCGHIHEAEGIAVQLGRTQAFSVGKRGHLLELAPL
ncbi:MAG: metallophosphoesterase [Bryobacterales bacterium]|nr:metallophosphoesterase [Bryobacteraceae bacterium]MDW8129672.1 metallophosphoesterase [Bryobacterales bacterium]